jgi:hypothetical protein
MSTAPSRTARVLAAFAGPVCSPLLVAAQEKSMPEQIADVMVQLNGGIHPGFRFTHAKGLVLTGTFTPAPSARTVSREGAFTDIVSNSHNGFFGGLLP